MNAPKLTVHESPTAQVIAAAKAEFVFTDAKGRAITLKKPGVLAQYRLIEALGPSASNETYVSMVLPLIYVAKIDDDVLTPPTTKIQVEALIQRLDEEGVAGVMENVQANFGKPDPKQDEVNVKN